MQGSTAWIGHNVNDWTLRHSVNGNLTNEVSDNEDPVNESR